MLLAYCDGSFASISVLGSHPTAHGFFLASGSTLEQLESIQAHWSHDSCLLPNRKLESWLAVVVKHTASVGLMGSKYK